MKRALFGLLLWAAVAACVVLAVRLAPTPTARAQSFVADTTNAPFVSLTPDALCKFWSNQAQANGVSGDPGWNTAMATLFSSANWPGVNATSLAFLRSFFVQYVHVGVP